MKKSELKQLIREVITEDSSDVYKLRQTHVKNGLWIWNNKHLTSLGNVEIIDGGVTIENCPNLTSLGNLRTINGNLALRSCPNLTSLGNLQTVNGFVFINGLALTSLGNLRTVKYNCNIQDCSKLKSLGNLQKVGGDLNLQGTPIKSIDNIKVGGETRTSEIKYKEPGQISERPVPIKKEGKSFDFDKLARGNFVPELVSWLGFLRYLGPERSYKEVVGGWSGNGYEGIRTHTIVLDRNSRSISITDNSSNRGDYYYNTLEDAVNALLSIVGEKYRYELKVAMYGRSS